MGKKIKIIGVIQARMGSTRLPGKILAPIAGRPLLQVLIERLRRKPGGSPTVDEWWLATTENEEDQLTASWGEALGLRVFRGSTDDVLSRFVGILKQTQADWVVRITADDPFMDGNTLSIMLQQALEAKDDVALIAESPDKRSYPLGYIPQVARANAILEADTSILATEPWHRSHVLSWTTAHRKVEAIKPFLGLKIHPEWRWTVDTAEDLEMAQQAFGLLGEDWVSSGYPELTKLFEDHPELVAINQHQAQKAVHQG